MVETGDNPTVRVLRVLELLRVRPGSSAAQLAVNLGVSERAIRRHIATLRYADVAVESVPGRYGGYRLGGGLRLPPLVFSSSEALGLVMAVLDGQHAGDAGGESVGAALDKIIKALPRHVAQQAALLRTHALTTPDRRSARPDPTTTSQLVQAVAARHRVRITYQSRSGPTRTHAVDPWAVVVRHGHWYLLCLLRPVDAVRTYRLDRINALEITSKTFTPPDDLDAVALLESHLGRGREFTTRVRFNAPIATVAPHVTPPMGELESTADDTACLLVGTTSNPEMYASEWLPSIPHPFVVEGGPELRQAMTALAHRLADAVQG